MLWSVTHHYAGRNLQRTFLTVFIIIFFRPFAVRRYFSSRTNSVFVFPKYPVISQCYTNLRRNIYGRMLKKLAGILYKVGAGFGSASGSGSGLACAETRILSKTGPDQQHWLGSGSRPYLLDPHPDPTRVICNQNHVQPFPRNDYSSTAAHLKRLEPDPPTLSVTCLVFYLCSALKLSTYLVFAKGLVFCKLHYYFLFSPVELLKSTLLGGSWMKTGPDKS